MYKELEKYKTGKKVTVEYDVIGKHRNSILLNEDEYSIGLGDLVNDFVKHKNKHFWQRKYYHNHLTEIYLKMLNQITIHHSF